MRIFGNNKPVIYIKPHSEAAEIPKDHTEACTLESITSDKSIEQTNIRWFGNLKSKHRTPDRIRELAALPSKLAQAKASQNGTVTLGDKQFLRGTDNQEKYIFVDTDVGLWWDVDERDRVHWKVGDKWSSAKAVLEEGQKIRVPIKGVINPKTGNCARAKAFTTLERNPPAWEIPASVRKAISPSD